MLEVYPENIAYHEPEDYLKSIKLDVEREKNRINARKRYSEHREEVKAKNLKRYHEQRDYFNNLSPEKVLKIMNGGKYENNL